MNPQYRLKPVATITDEYVVRVTAVVPHTLERMFSESSCSRRIVHERLLVIIVVVVLEAQVHERLLVIIVVVHERLLVIIVVVLEAHRVPTLREQRRQRLLVIIVVVLGVLGVLGTKATIAIVHLLPLWRSWAACGSTILVVIVIAIVCHNDAHQSIVCLQLLPPGCMSMGYVFTPPCSNGLDGTS